MTVHGSKNQITTPEELKAAFAYQFARPIDRRAFGFARGWFPLIVRTCQAIERSCARTDTDTAFTGCR
jgi:hypothetical protein